VGSADLCIIVLRVRCIIVVKIMKSPSESIPGCGEGFCMSKWPRELIAMPVGALASVRDTQAELING